MCSPDSEEKNHSGEFGVKITLVVLVLLLYGALHSKGKSSLPERNLIMV